MERWCPRCEWVGTSQDGACPSCGTPLLPVAALPAAAPGGPAGSAASDDVPETRARAPAPAAPAAVSGVVDPDEPAPSARRAARRRAIVVASLAALVAFVLLSNLLPRGSPGPSQRPQAAAETRGPAGGGSFPGPPFPERLTYIVSGLDGGPGPQLYMGDGQGRNATAPEDGRRAAWFVWSGDGSHVAVVDTGGTLHLIPGGGTYPGPVRDVAFSPRGDRLAVCVGIGMPRVEVLQTGPRLQAVRTVPGCSPSWSPYGRWLAYRVPGPTPQSPDRPMTLDVATGRTTRISGVGPLAWSPASGYAETPVTNVSPDCRTIQLSGADGRTGNTLAGIPELQTNDRPPRGSCPVTILSWSPDGRWLAIGLGPWQGATGWMILLDPLTQYIVELPQLHESGLTPVAVTWSPDGRVLLAECRMQNGEPFTIEVSPDGSAVAHNILAGRVTWSPDGRWILGEALNGWVAFDATDPLTWVQLAGYRAGWTQAAWCCPPSTTTSAAERTDGPPALLQPAR